MNPNINSTALSERNMTDNIQLKVVEFPPFCITHFYRGGVKGDVEGTSDRSVKDLFQKAVNEVNWQGETKPESMARMTFMRERTVPTRDE